jgi:hypothetical protein
MKRLLYILQFPLFIAFNFFAFTAMMQLFSKSSVNDRFASGAPGYNGYEDYDPSLGRLASVTSLEKYCDSLYNANESTLKGASYEERYTQLVSSVVRKRFYHGYSNFGIDNNFAAVVFSPLTGKNASAIVLPNEILKYPYAACSQQSIVVLSVLKKKEILSRPITFSGTKNGHFCFETYYNNEWHFFDPDMEPDVKVLSAYNRPGIAYLAKNPSILLAAYSHIPSETVLDIFTHYKYHSPSGSPAPRAALYQKITRVLSYMLWSFFLLLFIVTRSKYLGLKDKVSIRRIRRPVVIEQPSAYVPA